MKIKTLGFSVLFSVLCFSTYVIIAAASSVSGSIVSGIETNAGDMDGVLKAAPTPSVAAGTYNSAQSVSLSASASTAICYTIDGTTPSCASATTCTVGTKYSSAISVSSTKTIKSVACYNDNSTGPMATSAYTINVSSGGSSSSGGGGGGYTLYCSDVTYGPWQACVGSVQTRLVTSKSPANCTLTANHQLAATQACVTNTATSSPTTTSPTSSGQTGSQTGASSALSGNALKDQVMAREQAKIGKIDLVLSKRLKGMILLQVEERGEAWYVSPTDNSRYYLGRPVDAFSIMRSFGLGVVHSVIAAKTIPSRLYGYILIDVEDHGKAYWINPEDGSKNYLGRPDDAYNILKGHGLGISNANLRTIQLGR